MNTAELLASVGQAIYGPQWQQMMARRLVVSDRSLRDWLATGRVPPGVVAELASIARADADSFDKRSQTLRRAAAQLEAKRAPGLADHRDPVPSIKLDNGTTLDDFRVIPTGSWDDPEIRFQHEAFTALAMVTREAWEDFFQMPSGELMSSNDARLLSQANLVRLAPVIAKKFQAGQFEQRERAGGVYPLVILKEADLRRAGPGMSKDILAQTRHARLPPNNF